MVSQERVFENLHLVLAAESYVWLYSPIYQEVDAHVRWNTINTVIGEIRWLFGNGRGDHAVMLVLFPRLPPSILTLFTSLSVSSSSIILPSVKRGSHVISFYVPNSV